MDSLIHADIFFFVTTIAVVLITALFIVAILYIVRILSDLHYISRVVRRETDVLAEEFDEIVGQLKKEGLFSGLASLIAGLLTGRRQRSKANSNDANSNKKEKTLKNGKNKK